MASIYNMTIPVGTTGDTYDLTIDYSQMSANTDELYKQNPAKALEYYNMEDADGNRYINNPISRCTF